MGTSPHPEITVEDIAKICHEANKAYCEAIGDTSQQHWEAAPEWQKQSAISGVLYATVNPNVGPIEMHKSWMGKKQLEGWVYGEVKDAEKKTHPCMVPYDELPLAQRFKDSLFLRIVRTLRPA